MAESSDAALGSHVEAETKPAALSDPPTSYTYYHAGPLFTVAELQNNVRLSGMIHKLSGGKFQPILPQDLEQRDTTPHSIRDQDIKALVNCDLALFTYDGMELDSGTVVEYMMAKFADVPAVILRSDFRGSGDQGRDGEPWNLMCSFWPRSVGIVVNSMVEYKTGLAQAMAFRDGATPHDISVCNQHAGDRLIEETARKVIEGFEEVLRKPARLPKELRESVYTWLALMPTFKHDNDTENITQMLQLSQTKGEKGLL